MSEKNNMRVFLFILSLFVLSCNQRPDFQTLNIGDPVFHRSFSEGFEKENFVLNEQKSAVDILIVVDTSQSMYHHLNRLGQSLSDLLSVISNYDWQIGFTSVDHGDHKEPSLIQQNWKDYVLSPRGRFGSLMNLENGKNLLKDKILRPQTFNYEDVFFHTLSHSPEKNCNRPPYCHSRIEQPLRSLKASIERAHLDNSSFFRPNADVVTLIITNEEERAEDRDRATTAKDVVKAFDKTFNKFNKKLISFNILVLDEACKKKESKKSDVISIAHSISHLAKLTGGSNISICSEDYGQALGLISRHIKESLENSVLLKKQPNPESLVVESDQGIDLDWELYGRKIVFGKKNISSEISVSVSYESRD